MSLRKTATMFIIFDSFLHRGGIDLYHKKSFDVMAAFVRFIE
jgi:hypothetical protein